MHLASPVNLPSLLKYADRFSRGGWQIAAALKSFASPEVAPYLRRWFASTTLDNETGIFAKTTHNELRVFAAWGLVKQDDLKALKFLIKMLDDPHRDGPNFSDPGCGLRAAQALCDLYDWPFEWHVSTIPKVKQRLPSITDAQGKLILPKRWKKTSSTAKRKSPVKRKKSRRENE
jgi:hypothetical protein